MEQRPIELARDGAAHLLAECDAALEAGEIDEAEWHRRVAAVITPAHLAADARSITRAGAAHSAPVCAPRGAGAIR